MLGERAVSHDDSKMESPELALFDEYTPKLAGCTYGSEEYQKFLVELKPALDHHYAVNRHHPEHFEEGVAGMNLVDVVEMFCDWFAASKRHDDGDIYKSINFNKDRFHLPVELVSIFHNTADILLQ
jgi:hypothetical protein